MLYPVKEMFLFKKKDDLKEHISFLRSHGKTLGFVPTMGALHEGHLSLVRKSREDNDVTICCIFINPTQFNKADDLKKYPHRPAKDIELLEKAGNDLLFMPSTQEVYPPGLVLDLQLNLGSLDKKMEGAFRPGHFKGVAQVIHRLLDMVCPDRLYMGQKDFQQFAIVSHMLEMTNSAVDIVMCPIIRESDGLAMSSRNLRLSRKIRDKAGIIYQALCLARQMAPGHSPAGIQKLALQKLDLPDFRAEYFEIVDGDTLLPIKQFDEAKLVIACTAVWAGDVRLIDNTILKKTQ